MNAITQCPECGTRFKVSAAQLEAHHGTVRCGHCQATFDATHNLYTGEPSPQLDLPIEPVAAAIPGDADSGSVDSAGNTDTPVVRSPIAEESPSQSGTGSEEPRPTALDALPGKQPPLTRKKHAWPWIAGSAIGLAILLTQTTYFFRAEVAARLPGLKPALNAACATLKCVVPLPRHADKLSIESSSLEIQAQRPNVITVNAILRNRASFAQAYPHIWLTFTDTSDEVLARRILAPTEYLAKEESEVRGLGANREAAINVHLDTAELRPSGYSLFLSYLP